MRENGQMSSDSECVNEFGGYVSSDRNFLVYFQFLNKNIAFRTICSTPFSAPKNANRITTNCPTAFHRCQRNAVLNASTMSHDKFPTQIDFIRSFSSNTVALSNFGSTLREKFQKMIGFHKNSKSVNTTFQLPRREIDCSPRIKSLSSTEFESGCLLSVRRGVRQH